MLNITLDNPFDIFTDRLIKFGGYNYFTLKKNSLIYLHAYKKDNINLFLTNELNIGDCFKLNFPDNSMWEINLPEFDIFNIKRNEYIFKGIMFQIVDINSIDSKMVISHQYPNIVTKIPKENAQ